MTDDGQALRVDAEQPGTLSPHPGDGVEHVGEDLGQLGFGRQAIVDGDHDVAGIEVAFELTGVDIVAIAEHQRPTVDPDNDRAQAWTGRRIDVGVNSALLGGFEDVCDSIHHAVSLPLCRQTRR